MTEAQWNVFILNCLHDLFIFWILNLWICPVKVTWIFLVKRSHDGKRQADFLINLFLPSQINKGQSDVECVQSSSSRIHPRLRLISSHNPPVLNSFSGLWILTQFLTIPTSEIPQTHNEIKMSNQSCYFCSKEQVQISVSSTLVLYPMEKLHHKVLEWHKGD